MRIVSKGPPVRLRFGAQLMQRLPVTYREPGAENSTEACVWRMEPPDYPDLFKEIGDWRDRLSGVMDTGCLEAVCKKLYKDTLTAFRGFDPTKIYVKNFRGRLKQWLGLIPEREEFFVLTGDGPDRPHRWQQGKPLAVMMLQQSKRELYLHTLEAADWNRHLETKRRREYRHAISGHYSGFLEAMVYSIVKEHPGKKLAWIPENTKIERFYRGLLQRMIPGLKIRPPKVYQKDYWEYSLRPRDLKKLVTAYEGRLDRDGGLMTPTRTMTALKHIG